ncbi:MAG: site-specific DNA-methyltransferase, partial [Anaerolineae bacterium]
MNKEQQFFQALQDIFVGATVEGESGYINLMRIKSRYYQQGVFPRLKQDIDQALKPFPDFREELFDKLYTFFRRYFSESGSIYFRHTPLYQNVYERVYTDDRDVILFWKTHMLYYVKTDRLFRSMEVEADGHRFYFDVSTLEHKKANEKKSLVFEFRERRGDGTLAFSVTYSERGRKTQMDDIRRALRQMGLDVPEETLERAFRLFERQSEVDYFINKDARKFLCEQFDLWLYQYVFEPEQRSGTLWAETRIRQLQVLKDIAYKTIAFIAQFEDELVRIWNKPKFVLHSHYVITLDRIAAQEGGPALLARLLAHPGMAAQVQEWRDLGIVGADFTPLEVWQTELTGARLHPRYQHLPLDTTHFPDLELEVLALFDHLDQQLDGWLIKSENYQALNTLSRKFR